MATSPNQTPQGGSYGDRIPIAAIFARTISILSPGPPLGSCPPVTARLSRTVRCRDHRNRWRLFRAMPACHGSTFRVPPSRDRIGCTHIEP